MPCPISDEAWPNGEQELIGRELLPARQGAEGAGRGPGWGGAAAKELSDKALASSYTWQRRNINKEGLFFE